MQFELYLRDLKPEAQERYLEFAGRDLNEDFPIAVLEIEEDRAATPV